MLALRTRLAALPREARDTLFLLLVIAWLVMPQTGNLPWWCSLLAAGVLLWRGWLALAVKPLPSRWWLLTLLVVTVVVVVRVVPGGGGAPIGLSVLVRCDQCFPCSGSFRSRLITTGRVTDRSQTAGTRISGLHGNNTDLLRVCDRARRGNGRLLFLIEQQRRSPIDVQFDVQWSSSRCLLICAVSVQSVFSVFRPLRSCRFASGGVMNGSQTAGTA